MARAKDKGPPEHIHKYERYIMGKNYAVMRCVLPNCTHYIRKDLAKNKVSICHRCSNPFIIDGRALKMEKPCCINCIQHKNKPEIDRLKELFK